MILAELVRCEILLVGNLSSDEISDLIKREEITSLANSRFASGEISFQDYLDCLEVAQVDIDDFLITANDNSQLLGF